MAEGRAIRGPRRAPSNLASPAAAAASPKSLQDNDILSRAILEAQKLVENLIRIKAAAPPLDARLTPATRRASRRQSSDPASATAEHDELRDVAETSWELTRQQNGLVGVTLRRLEAEGKLSPMTHESPQVPADMLEDLPADPPPCSSPSPKPEEPSLILPCCQPNGEPGVLLEHYHDDSRKLLSERFLDSLPELLPNYHPDDLPEMLPNYHPDDLQYLPDASYVSSEKLPRRHLAGSLSSLAATAPSSEPDAASEDDGTTLVDVAAEQPRKIGADKQGPPETAVAIEKIFENLWLIAGVKHAFDGRVLVLHPTVEQWQDFTNILDVARKLGAGDVGAFKIRLSDDMLESLGPCNQEEHVPRPKKPCNGYRSKRLPNMTFNVTTTNDHRVFRKSDPSPLPLLEAVRHQEYLLRKKQGLKGVFYRTDIPVQTPEDRHNAGLPARSAIWPLKGDMLRHTKQEIPGIHWPYGYESAAEFGAVFAMHNEDFNLHSVSHLHQGRKIWIMIPPESAEALEKKMREMDPSIGNCGQCIRHRSLFIPTTLLDEWKIPYTVVDQRAPEVVITMPQTYHSGFSTGYTLAEASNYADSDWTPVGYPSCPDTCPDFPIDGTLMAFLEPGETQRKYEPENESEVAVTERHDDTVNLSPPIGARTTPAEKAKARTAKHPSQTKDMETATKKDPVPKATLESEQAPPRLEMEVSEAGSQNKKRISEQPLAPSASKKHKATAEASLSDHVREPFQPIDQHPLVGVPLQHPAPSLEPMG